MAGDAVSAIDDLCALVKEAGGTMRLYGKPVTAIELREHCEKSAAERVRSALMRGVEHVKDCRIRGVKPESIVDRAVEEAQWRAVWSDEAP